MTGQERGPAPLLSRAETTAVLSEVLRRVRGADARLVDWTAERLKHGRHPVVRYDVRVTLGGGGDTRRYSWVGKFYRHDEAARRVADLVAALAPTGLRARGGVVIPAVLAYHSPHRILFSVYERGQALAAAILQFGGRVVATLGRALAAFHATPLHVATRITPQAVLDDLRSRIARGDDRVRAVGSLSGLVDQLERDLPAASGRATGALLHGDLGPAHLLWRRSGVVMLDLDRCARGDPALDLGNLLAQWRRAALRRPGEVPGFAPVRAALLTSYQRCGTRDPGLPARAAWYERATLLRKIHSLLTDTTRHPEPEALRRRQGEAVRLLWTGT